MKPGTYGMFKMATSLHIVIVYLSFVYVNNTPYDLQVLANLAIKGNQSLLALTI